jgi:ring-1,2-phenylacetyl-CoA epoxidase subunit PaaD
MTPTRENIFEILASVRDPEVPVLSVVDLGIVRDVQISGGIISVKVTPTYSGCPAMRVIEENIIAALREKGFPNAEVTTVFSPAWTTDWMSPEAKEKLRAYGIAPPQGRADDSLVTISKPRPTIACPFCGSKNTALKSEFGSTACKSLHYCNQCSQPFEHFKAF